MSEMTISPTQKMWILRIETISDWHVGSGQGEAGGVDRRVIRDVDGLPFLPAKQLKGLWRDACERVSWGLDDGQDDGGWTRLAATLFGSVPSMAGSMVAVGDARLEQSWRQRLNDSTSDLDPRERDLIRRGLTTTRFGVAINGATGTARDDMLREIEVARCGLTLATSCFVPESLPWQAEMLLLAGLESLDHLGAKRRRGLGRCRVTATSGPSASSVASLLAQHEDQVDSEPPRLIRNPATLPAIATAATPTPEHPRWRRRARVQLVAAQAVVATKQVLGNTVISHHFVPGATLLPIVTPACGRDVARLLREGRLVVTDATIGLGEVRATPMPLGVVSDEKGDAWRTTHVAHDVFAHDIDETLVGEKPIGGWRLPGTPPSQVHTPTVTRAHAVIEDDTQRTGDNGMFVYEGIAPGTLLAFEVWDDGSLDGVWDATQIPAQCSVGRSRLSGYGEVTVTVYKEPTPEVHQPDGDELDRFVLTLESDTVILDDLGHPDASAAGLASWLTAQLGVSLQAVRSRVSVTRRDSWYAELATSKTTAVALAGGSQIEFRVDGSVDRGALQSLIDGGIGALFVEGYGRARIDEHEEGDVPMTGKVLGAQATELNQPSYEPTFRDDPVWTTVRREVWRDELHARVVEMSDEARNLIVSPDASPSQLGSLREASRQGMEAVGRWVSSTEDREGQRRVWGSDRLRKIKGLSLESATADPPHPIVAFFNASVIRPLFAVPDDLGGNSRDDVIAMLLGEATRKETLHRAAMFTATGDRKENA